jgi:hypothetical protein
MSQESEAKKIRAKQVGVLMKHYRSSFPVGDGRAGLTMEDVLERMAQVNQRYENSAPSTVYRWETGQTMPRKKRLQEFGIALNLSQLEIDGLVALAGIDTENRLDATNGTGVVPEDLEDVPVATTGTGRLAPEGAGTFGEPAVRSFLVETLKGGILRFLLPALAIAGGGYLLSSLGITVTWMLVLYIGLAMGLVVSQGLFKMRRAGNLRELLFVTLFIVLSTGLLQVPFIGMDPYGFYIWGEPGGIVLPILLSLMANLVVSLIASLMFDLLWRWQYSGRGADKAYMRSLWVAVPPMAFTYSWVLLTGNWGAWIGCSVMLTILAGVFAMLTVMRDETVKFTEWDRRFLLWCSMQITTVLAALGAVSIAVGYMDPSLLSLSGHTLIHPWEIDYAALGYSESELIARLRVGYAWNSITCISYLVIVIGSYVTLNIYRLGGGDPAVPTADVGELPPGTSRERTSRKERIKALLGPGGLAGYPLHPEPA